MRYLEVVISLGSERVDEAASRLILGGFPRLVLGESGPDDERPLEGNVVKLYLADPEISWRLPAIRALLEGLNVDLETRFLDEEDWAHSWKRFWGVQHIGNRWVVRPSWEPYRERAGDLVIALDPKQAFGTGTHPTTRLCLRALERLVCSGDVVYDIGTGSGILAVAALKLGAATAIGVDDDPVAISAARDNARLNDFSDSCQWILGTIDSLRDDGDLVVANINHAFVFAQAASLARVIKRDLIVSGIITRDAPAIQGALESEGLDFVSQDIENEWVAQVFRAGRRCH